VWAGLVSICDGDSISFRADTVLYGGLTPEFQWFVNGDTASNGRDSIFTYRPSNGDIVLCRMVSRENCISSDTVFSSAVKVVVLPLPVFTSADTIATCSEFTANYEPTTDIPATYTWTRAEVAGITPQTGSGSGNINEVLTNSTNSPITVTYIVTANSNGCITTKPVTIIVNPKRRPTIAIEVVPRN
jgi:hypothetical protein